MTPDTSGQTYANNENVQKITEVMNGKAAEQDKTPASAKPQEIPEDDIDSSIVNDTDNIIAAGEQDFNELDSKSVADDIPEPSNITLKDLAGELHVNSKDLYDVEIPMGAGNKAVKLGELKDSFKEYLNLKSGQAEFEQNKTRSENEMMVTRRQLEQVVSLAINTGQMSPELLTQLDTIENTRVSKERSALMSAIPEWSDPNTRATDFNDMVSELMPYGFSRVDIEHVTDHRLVKYVHDNTKRNKLVSNARAKTKAQQLTGKNNPTFKKKQSELQQRINRAKSGTNSDKTGAITALLNS